MSDAKTDGRQVSPPPGKKVCQPETEQPPELEAQTSFDSEESGESLGKAQLCLPSAHWTILASIIASLFMFLGLLTLSLGELESQLNQRDLTVSNPLGWRWMGWTFLFYIPIMWTAAPFIRNYAVWGLQPCQSFSDAYRKGHETSKWLRVLRSLLIPCSLQVIFMTVYSLLISVAVAGEHLGIFPIFVLSNVLSMLLAILFLRICGPSALSKRYAFSVGPSCVFFPIFGFAVVVIGYRSLRRIGGVWFGLFMPLILSTYEFLGAFVVAKNFTKKFLTKKTVREAYAGTNQGILVSIAICNLHGLAEGARFTLLYVDYMSGDSRILVPIISGVLWNVLMRIGCMDRLLHVISCKYWRPNNSSKLLRESGYCMGYPRFGAVGALLLTRLCIGTAPSIESPELQLVLMVLLAEVVEDFLSCSLWRLDVNVSPAPSSLTESELAKISEARLSRKSASRPSSTHKLASVLPVKEQVTSDTSTNAPVDTATEISVPVISSENLPSIEWKVQEEHNFFYGGEDFGKLPFWAHLLPAALAQFHTILALIAFSNGLPEILGCESIISQSLLFSPAKSPCL